MKASQLQVKQSKVLIIASMHRSGSSLTASLLQTAGLHIGARLLQSCPSNIKGHFENLDFFDFHKAVLKSQGLHEDGWTFQQKIEVSSNFSEKAKEIISKNCCYPCWGWKDPRTTLFLEFWAEFLPEAHFLFVYRVPWEVINSLHRRNTDLILRSEPELAIKFWLHYNQRILNFYEKISPDRCLLVNIDTIIQDSQTFIKAINDKFELALKKIKDNVYDSSIWHNHQENSYLPRLINYFSPNAIQMYERLENLAWHPQGKPDASWRKHLKVSPLPQIQADLARSRDRLEKIKAELGSSHLL